MIKYVDLTKNSTCKELITKYFRDLGLFLIKLLPCSNSISKRIWSHVFRSAELALNKKDYLFFSFVFGLINSTRSFSFYSPAMAKIAMYFSMCQNAKVGVKLCTTTFLSQLFIATFCCNLFVNDFAFATTLPIENAL